MDVEITDRAVPLELVINRVGTGPACGLSPRVLVREIMRPLAIEEEEIEGGEEDEDENEDERYLDFSDLIFKSSGWVCREMPLEEVRPGIYQAMLDVSGIESLEVGDRLAIEYTVTSPPDAPCDRSIDVDVFTIVSEQRRRPLRYVAQVRKAPLFSWEQAEAELEQVAGVPTSFSGPMVTRSSSTAEYAFLGMFAAAALGFLVFSAVRR